MVNIISTQCQQQIKPKKPKRLRTLPAQAYLGAAKAESQADYLRELRQLWEDSS